MRSRLIFVPLIILIGNVHLEEKTNPVKNLEKEGASYLQNTMKQLQNEKVEGQPVELTELNKLITMNTHEDDDDEVVHNVPISHIDKVKKKPYQLPITNGITGPTPLPLESEVIAGNPPPLELTKEELAAIYQAAITKGASLFDLQTMSDQETPHFNLPLKNFQLSSANTAIQPASQGASGSFPGYYYYFYPIKSFLKAQDDKNLMKPTVPIEEMASMMGGDKNKAVEPLFMAVSGFVGMALMFAFSVLFLPKLGIFRSGNGGLIKLKESPDDLVNIASFGRILIDTLDGKDCTERMACEVGKLVRGMKVDSKPLKVLEIILPPYIGKQIAMVRKAVGKKEKCSYIPCKYVSPRPPTKNEKSKFGKKPLKPFNELSPHEQWMKHFEKETVHKTPSLKIWRKKKPEEQSNLSESDERIIP